MMLTPEEVAAIRKDLSGLVYLSDGTRGADRLGRLVAAVPQLIADRDELAGPPAPGCVRLICNMNAETAAALRTLATARDKSYTEMIRRAIAVLKLAEDATLAGKRIQLVDDDGHVETVVLT